jgi:MFS family permease
LLENRDLVSAIALALGFAASFGAVLYFLTIYLQDLHGFGALQAGAAFLLPTSMVVLGSTSAGAMVSRFGLRSVVLVGLGVGSIGAVACGIAMSANSPFLVLAPCLVLISVADGAIYTGIYISAGSGVADEQQGVAAAATTTAASVGAGIGLAMLVLLAGAGSSASPGGARSLGADDVGRALFGIGIVIASTMPIAARLQPARSGASGRDPIKLARCGRPR